MVVQQRERELRKGNLIRPVQRLLPGGQVGVRFDQIDVEFLRQGRVGIELREFYCIL